MIALSASRRAFTLVELMVVISIIALLAGLAFPAITGALVSAKKTETKMLLSNIKLGIDRYFADYGKLPPVGGFTSDTEFKSDSAEGRELTRILVNDDQAAELNPRGNVYLQANPKNYKGGNTEDRILIDSWKNPFYVVIDFDYSEILEPSAFQEMGRAPENARPPRDGLRASSALWSQGPLPKLDTKANAQDIVSTWN